MAHVMQKLLDRVNITHPGERRANLREMLEAQREEIERQYQSGRISRDVGLDSTRHLMELALEEIINSPAEYRAAMKSGQIDAMREAIAGWDDTISTEAAERKRRDAFNITLGHRADDHLAAGQLSAADYNWTMDELGLDPGSINAARVHTGTNEISPDNLDQNVRPIADDEQGPVATAAWQRRYGMLPDPPAQSEPDAPQAEHSGDWSESEMTGFVERRERETNFSKED